MRPLNDAFSIFRTLGFNPSNTPHTLNDLPPLINARRCFQTPLDCPVAEATRIVRTKRVRQVGTMPYIEMKLPVSHHLESFGAYSINDLGALTRISDLEFLLKKYRCLLVRKFNNSRDKEVIRRGRGRV